MMGVTAHLLCRILLFESKAQVLATLKRRGLHKDVTQQAEIVGVTLK